MEKINNLITGLLLMILISCNSSPTQIFVAPNGSDTNGTGSSGQPFSSLERAREEIRMLKNEGKTDNGIQVNLRGGVYYRPETFTLTEEDSGISEEFPVVYAAFNNEKVIIHGGINIPVPRDGDFSNRGGIFHFDTDRPLSWQSHNDIWISGYFGYGWAEDAVELANIDRITANHLTA